MMSLDMHLTHRLWEWKCRTLDYIPLRLANLPLTELPLERIPDGVQGLDLSWTKIDDPLYPAKLPATVTSLRHSGFFGKTLEGLEHTRLKSLTLSNCPYLEALGPLPPTLHTLNLDNCPALVSLSAFPPSLMFLSIRMAPQLTSLPPLPPKLHTLDLVDANITSIPLAHDDIVYINACTKSFWCRLLRTPANPWLSYSFGGDCYQLASLSRSMRRQSLFKEDLIAATWHPDRFEQWCLDTEEKKENEMMMGV
jgi:hypothetical protein